MKSVLAVIGCLVLWAAPCLAETGFRQTSWGMSLEEVKAIEGEDVDILSDSSFPKRTILKFDRFVGGLPASTVYVLFEDQLTQGHYIFANKHSENALYLEDYRKIGGILKKKYGPPSDEQETWVNDSLKDQPNLRGKALSMGQLKINSIWNTKTTTIDHSLSGDRSEINHGVSYESLAHKESVQRVIDAQHLKDF